MVTEADLTEMLQTMTPNDLRSAEDHLRGLGPGPRACPSCSIPMEAVQLEGETLDRCPTHGFWFDVHELAKALDPANDFEASHQHKVIVADVLEYGELGAVIAHLWRRRRTK